MVIGKSPFFIHKIILNQEEAQMKNKRILALVCAVICLIPMLTVGVSARDFHSYPQDETNYGYDSDYEIAENIVEMANASIDALIFIAQLGIISPDCLVYLTDMISQAAIAEVESYGFTAVCEYVPYDICGQIVYIDPLRIIKK